MPRFRQMTDRVARGTRQAARRLYQFLKRSRPPSGYKAELREMRAELIAEFSAELAFGFHDLQQMLEAKYAELATFATELKQAQDRAVETLAAFDRANAVAETRLGALQTRLTDARSVAAGNKGLINLQSETKNLVTHLQTSTDTRLSNIDNALSEAKNLMTHLNTSLHTRLNILQNEEIPSLSNEIHELTALHFHRMASAQSNRTQWVAFPEERYERARPQSFDAYLAVAKAEMPRAYPLWRERLDAIREAFSKTKIGNAAHAGDVYSRLFRSFVEIYAVGRVLDVGCGVFGRPYYLMSYPADLISGLDPLAPVEPCDFEFVQGLSEYLPWPDGSFSTVISATSLDHCLDLERSVAEIERVLRSGGRVVLWIGSVPGAIRPDLHDSAFAPADQFHIFHFDKAWLEPVLEQRFETIDRIELRRSGYSHVMYSLRKRKR
jgi:SAM-dependent methyltransferase